MTPRRWAFLRVMFGRHEITPPTKGSNMNIAWIKDAGERLFWTAVQGALAVLTAQQLGWVDLGDGEIWKLAAAGGLASALSLTKSLLAAQLSPGDTAQLGAHTYSYTATGPGAAGGDLVEEVVKK